MSRYRTTFWTRRNLLWSPVVIPLRLTLMLPLEILCRIGESSERAYNFLNELLPGFERSRVPLMPPAGARDAGEEG